MSVEKTHRIISNSQTVPSSVLKLLTGTFIGTNGTQYRLKSTEQKINELIEPHFFYLERNERAIGNITLCKRPIVIDETIQTGFYIRYFAFDLIFQSNRPKSHGQSSFHEYFRKIFSSSNLSAIKPERAKSIHWAFIDPENTRSAAMKEHFGFTTLGQFETFSFSRIRPRKRTSVERLDKNDQPIVLDEIRSFYKTYDLFATAHLFDNNNYFILKDSGQIVAGIQANPVTWEIKSLPGITGKIMVKIGHLIPGLRKLINPKNHQFLATEGVFWKPGHENCIEHLLEGVLYLMNRHSLLVWEDKNATAIKKLHLKWGLIQRLKQNNPIDVVAKCNGFSETEIKRMRASKKYISGFDVT